MIEWAQRASNLVFQEIEALHPDSIVTFCNLALFWNAQGAWKRAFVHKGK